MMFPQVIKITTSQSVEPILTWLWFQIYQNSLIYAYLVTYDYNYDSGHLSYDLIRL